MKDDVISRQAAIDVFYEMASDIDHLCTVGDYVHILETLSTIDPEPKWIPCSERQPLAEGGLSDKVLATCGYNDVYDTSIRWIRELYYNGRMWLYPSGRAYDQKVYAWMPLPEPWEEGGK